MLKLKEKRSENKLLVHARRNLLRVKVGCEMLLNSDDLNSEDARKLIDLIRMDANAAIFGLHDYMKGSD